MPNPLARDLASPFLVADPPLSGGVGDSVSSVFGSTWIGVASSSND
jgi:hypothetical protein